MRSLECATSERKRASLWRRWRSSAREAPSTASETWEASDSRESTSSRGEASVRTRARATRAPRPGQTGAAGVPMPVLGGEAVLAPLRAPWRAQSAAWTSWTSAEPRRASPSRAASRPRSGRGGDDRAFSFEQDEPHACRAARRARGRPRRRPRSPARGRRRRRARRPRSGVRARAPRVRSSCRPGRPCGSRRAGTARPTRR